MDRDRMEEEGGIPEITVRELKTRMDGQHPLVLLDVREPFEYEIADLPEYERIRIPMREVLSRVAELDSDANLVVYCRSGGRSGHIVEQLRQKGFSKAMNLKGGVLGWREEIDPTLREY